MNHPDDSIKFALKQLAVLDRQEAQVLALAKKPGVSRTDLRHSCRALFHLLCCRQIALATLADNGIELPSDARGNSRNGAC